MLVLTRKEQESIIITIPPSDKPQTIIVQVVKTRLGETRIGFNAPEEINIRREEIPLR